MTDEAIMDEIAREYVAAFTRMGLKDEQGQPYTENDVRALFSNTLDRQGLEVQIAAIRAACRKDGVMVLDSEGNPTLGC